MITMEIVRFAAIECKLQMSGELSVWHMLEAWEYAQKASKFVENYGPDNEFVKLVKPLPTLADVLNIGKLVEPHDNLNGFRRCGVQIGWDVKMDWENVPRQMDALLESLHAEPYKGDGYTVPVMTPEKFFKNFEEIHPFRDGNGRSGVILFNWLRGSLDNPIWAPNFWQDPRRTIGFGAS